VWAQVQTEKSAILRWPDADGSDFKIALYMIMP
jgi:hypothetical protein